MNAVDVNNQLRKTFSSHQQHERRIWRPLGYWLFDVCLTNSFIIWRELQSQKKQDGHRLHEEFERALISGLLQRGLHHLPMKRIGKRSRCHWGVLRPGECLQQPKVYNDDERMARRRKRSALGEISGNARLKTAPKRPRNVESGCSDCNLNLCITRACFQSYHVYLHTKYI